MYIFNYIGFIRKRLLGVVLFLLLSEVTLLAMETLPQTSAIQWRDTLYVRIADSAFINNSIAFDLEIYRPNDDWNKDIVLGDFDFYFSYGRKAFDGTTAPVFTALLPEIDQTVSPRKNLLFGYTHFYAGRYGICGRIDNSGGAKYTIPSKTWVKLCRVEIPMTKIDQNPEIVWDVRATGAMTAGGNPIILKLAGDVINNPKATVKAAGIVVSPQLQCQGEEVRLYVRDALTSGTDLKFIWKDSVAGETWNTLGTFNAATPVKTGSSKDGRYQFEVLSKGDTLVIKNTTGIVDGMFFKCTLHDASVNASMTVDTVVLLRDSLFGYLASTAPSVKLGMTGKIDTVKKCPNVDAPLHFYLLGPTATEIQQKEFGEKLKIYYRYQDKDLNVLRDSFEVTPAKLLSGRQKVATFPSSSLIKTDVFRCSVQTKHIGKMWVESIVTEFCNNGSGYPPYDTIFVKDVQGEIVYNLSDLTVSVNDQVALDTALLKDKTYQVYLKNDPSPLGGYITGSQSIGEVYYYNAANKVGYDTVYYAYKQESCDMKAYRSIEVVEYSYVRLKVLLFGPYLGVDNNGKDTMNCALNTTFDLFPKNNTFRYVSPYDEYSVLNNKISVMGDIKCGGTVCDWIFVKIRDGENGHYVDSVSALLRQDGIICDTSGNTYLKFKKLDAKPYNIVIEHRNHLTIMGKSMTLPKSKPTTDAITAGADFTKLVNLYDTDPSDTYEALTLFKGVYCMLPYDFNKDGLVSLADKGAALNSVAKFGYEACDADFDGYVFLIDVKYYATYHGKMIVFLK
ncbi:MAG: hypothetical protein RSA53_07185 [Odoribacter sp.]